MPSNYVRYGNPWVNSLTPPAISAAFLTALENVLIQPSGGSESGKYFLHSNSYVGSAFTGAYMQSISRTSIPVSVTIDEADSSHTTNNCAPAQTGNLTANGFQVYSSGVGVQPAWQVAGNYTINW